MKPSNPIWRGVVGIFEAMGDLFTFQASTRYRDRMKKLIDRDDAQNWYHQGEWWEHPIYRDQWRDGE